MLPPFVDTTWLSDHRDDVVLADVRFYLDGSSARAAYDAGHRAGAVFVDLDRWLSGPATSEDGRHPFPTSETFAEGMGALGVGDATPVVAYDDDGGVIAARLVWMLRSIGHPAALLDAPWPPEDLTTDEPPITPRVFTPRPWPAERLADIDEVAATSSTLIDARSHARYLGEPDGIDPRYGHIPSALSVPTRDHLAPTGVLRPQDELRERFSSVGITAAADVISYCGGGVTACHNLLVLEHADLGLGRLYPGSWSQWSSDPTRPIATDER
ncbi:Putative thiosulfate sulfurtransferase SseB [Baekduia alba]|uniref:sulfurtransferase n=1 Tax=Baekduia alba TaxID=2997333 RepID=UPI00233FE722|nr:sulfurtransferase [Baekduia alba]WCB97087.1 Putative thiosulfate sulfurtransferase SseB [Baekduia alba]